jgi:hypothetical protein
VSADVAMRLILRSEKLIPFFHDKRFVFFDNPGNFSQVMRPEAMIDRQPTGDNQNLASSSFCNMDMGRLVPVLGIKVQLKTN